MQDGQYPPVSHVYEPPGGMVASSCSWIKSRRWSHNFILHVLSVGFRTVTSQALAIDIEPNNNKETMIAIKILFILWSLNMSSPFRKVVLTKIEQFTCQSWNLLKSIRLCLYFHKRIQKVPTLWANTNFLVSMSYSCFQQRNKNIENSWDCQSFLLNPRNRRRIIGDLLAPVPCVFRVESEYRRIA
jgi:hypothetical protein